MVALVGAGKVGQQADLERRRSQAPQALERRGEVARREAEAVHAGVDLDPQHEAVRAGRLLQQLDLQRIVHHQIEAVARRLQQLLGGENPLEQHDRLCDSGGAQRQALLETRHGESVRLGEGERGRHQPVTVGVGFDHRHDVRAPRALTDDPKIVSQGARVDHGPDQPAHRSTPSAYESGT